MIRDGASFCHQPTFQASSKAKLLTQPIDTENANVLYLYQTSIATASCVYESSPTKLRACLILEYHKAKLALTAFNVSLPDTRHLRLGYR